MPSLIRSTSFAHEILVVFLVRMSLHCFIQIRVPTLYRVLSSVSFVHLINVWELRFMRYLAWGKVEVCKYGIMQEQVYVWRGQWQPTPVLLPGECHGRRSLVGYSPCGQEGSDTTERLHFHFSLSCTAEGSSNPLQYSCLENPRDGGAWWAAVYGVAQSRTRLM